MSTIQEDLIELRRLKKEAEEAGRKKKDADNEFKQWQNHCVERMEAEKVDSIGTGGTLFSLPKEPTIFGQVNDRRKFVEWAMENDPELITHKEIGEHINSLARRLLDDDQEFPPGLTFRTQRPIYQRKS